MPATGVRWWETDKRISRRLAGVFEGGGAKGAAYVGALEATLEAGCWFGAVAGASAGAITAALIAAGLTPTEIGSESTVAFERLGPLGLVPALRRLRSDFGALDNEGLRDWLEQILHGQVEGSGSSVTKSVTFAMLYQATEIELNVVVADASRGRQIVFSAWETPHAQVADAVVASSTIPFVFAPRYLRVPVDNERYVHTLVDGGAWSNYPDFVFRDRSFRASVGRPEEVAEDHIVGFILDEPGEGDPEFTESSFVGVEDDSDPIEWRSDASSPATQERSLRRRIVDGLLAVLLAPILLLVRFGAWLSLGNSRAWRGRWPRLSGRAGVLVGFLNDALSALHSLWLASIAGLAILAGAIAAIYWLITSFILLRIDEIRFDLPFGGWWSVAREVVQVLLVGVGIALIITVAVITLAALLVNAVALGPVRQVAYGLARTYAAGPGAPLWAGHSEKDFAIRLPIPADLTTLSFDATDPVVQTAIEVAVNDARDATRTGLAKVLSTQPTPGPPRPPASELAKRDEPPSAEGSVAPGSGGGPAFAFRLTIVALVATALLWTIVQVLPDPAWYRYDVNVRMCREPFTTPDSTCAEPTTTSAYAVVLFGPASGGTDRRAEMTINDRAVDVPPEIIELGRGQILNFPIEWQDQCGLQSCVVTVRAFVDGQSVFFGELQRDIQLDFERG